MPDLATAVDAVLDRAVSGVPAVPGVAAIVTDRDRTIYEGAAGVRILGGDAPMTTDTVCAVFSTTKAIAGTACLQLVEEGRLDLDAPAKQYVPELGELHVLDGFDADGDPVLRPPGRDITTRMLLLHTAGFGYDFFNEHYRRLAVEHDQPSVITASKDALMTPLLFDPGERWEYGSSIDWAGQVVEAITGSRLGDVLADRILGPLGMTSTAFVLTDELRSRRATVHRRAPDGDLRPMVDFELPPEPEIHMAGHGLYSTARDYIRFIRMWLNDGMGPHGSILLPDTVRTAARSHLGDRGITPLRSVDPRQTNDVEFFPGTHKSWGLTFMINDEDAPTGRPAGQLAWAGLANLYYWIDRASGVGGFWATQIFPFGDPASLDGYLEFETTVYDHLGRSAGLGRVRSTCGHVAAIFEPKMRIYEPASSLADELGLPGDWLNDGVKPPV